MHVSDLEDVIAAFIHTLLIVAICMYDLDSAVLYAYL